MAVLYDLNDKCDPWDHLECLIALAIWEENEILKEVLTGFYPT